MNSLMNIYCDLINGEDLITSQKYMCVIKIWKLLQHPWILNQKNNYLDKQPHSSGCLSATHHNKPADFSLYKTISQQTTQQYDSTPHQISSILSFVWSFFSLFKPFIYSFSYVCLFLPAFIQLFICSFILLSTHLFVSSRALSLIC